MAGTGNVDLSSPPPTSEAPPEATPRPRSIFGRRWAITLGVVAALLVVAIVVAYAVTGGFSRSNGPAVRILLPYGTTYEMNGGASTDFVMTVSTPSTLAGTFQTGGGIILYTMTFAQYDALVKSGNVTGYEWTSGKIAGQAYYTLDVLVPEGSWAFAFVDPSPINPTAVTFYTDVTLTPS